MYYFSSFSPVSQGSDAELLISSIDLHTYIGGLLLQTFFFSFQVDVSLHEQSTPSSCSITLLNSAVTLLMGLMQVNPFMHRKMAVSLTPC